MWATVNCVDVRQVVNANKGFNASCAHLVALTHASVQQGVAGGQCIVS